ncbi:MAG TPA: glycosyltransferase [Candidatus Marinimicrobia bacterium]|nr:glycosyltransferase [Candidatus Neomarinimicrobiota bacterium]
MVLFNMILGISAGVYLLFILYFLRGLHKIRPNNGLSDDYPPLAVIVAARNEEQHVRSTVQSLSAQNYPNDRYEIIVVNDRSEDKTGAILDELKETVSNLRTITITSCSPDISPKKHALIEAVKTTTCPFILTTDADCVQHPDWLRSYAALIEDDLGVATGITRFQQRTYHNRFERLWQNMQAIEYMSHQVVMAGAIGHNRGFTANGNNMMFNRQLYVAYESDALRKGIVSGDDFFIIQTAEKKHYRLKFNLSPAGVVQTPPQRTLRAVINQRARWSSKIGRAKAGVLFFSLNTFLYYLGLTIYPGLLLFFPSYGPLFLGMFGVKVFSDTFYMVYGYHKFGQKLNSLYYILMEFLHAPFIVIVAVIGSLFGFTWKGARYKVEVGSG